MPEPGRIPALAALLLLGACNLQPVYSNGSQGAAQTLLADVEVGPIPDRAGFLVRSRLVDRMQPSGNPRFKLEVAATIGETGQYRARVAVGVASITATSYLYIDPIVTVT